MMLFWNAFLHKLPLGPCIPGDTHSCWGCPLGAQRRAPAMVGGSSKRCGSSGVCTSSDDASRRFGGSFCPRLTLSPPSLPMGAPAVCVSGLVTSWSIAQARPLPVLPRVISLLQASTTHNSEVEKLFYDNSWGHPSCFTCNSIQNLFSSSYLLF